MIQFLLYNILKSIIFLYLYTRVIISRFVRILVLIFSKIPFRYIFYPFVYFYKVITFLLLLPLNLTEYIYIISTVFWKYLKKTVEILFLDKNKFSQKLNELFSSQKEKNTSLPVTINQKGGNRNSLIGSFKMLYKQKSALKSIVIRDVRQEFIQTQLGPIWFFIMPFIQATVFYVVFGNVGKMPTEGSNAFFFYIFGLLVWSSYSQASINISYTLVENAGILTKVPCSPLLFPFSKAYFRLIQCCVNLIVFYFVYICLQGFSAIKLSIFSPFFIILGLAIVMLTAMSGGLIAAALSIKKRDFLYLWSFIITALMYLTPIIYPFRALPLKWKYIAAINPLTSGIEMVRSTILGLPILDLKFILMGLCTLFILIIFCTYFYLSRFRLAMDHL